VQQDALMPAKLLQRFLLKNGQTHHKKHGRKRNKKLMEWFWFVACLVAAFAFALPDAGSVNYDKLRPSTPEESHLLFNNFFRLHISSLPINY
jgi:hypothetical protein